MVDRDLRVVSSEKLKIPVARSPLVLQPGTGKVTSAAVVPVRGQPLGAAPVVAELDKGSVVERLGTFGPFTKVGLGADRFGFAETRLLKDATGAVKPLLRPLLSHSPPLLEVKPAKLATREARVRIEGNAADADRVMDAVVFVGSRKVFYQSNKKAADPTKLKFSFDAELQPGINVITVVARENADSTTRATMMVRRDGPNGEALPTPKVDTLEEDWKSAATTDVVSPAARKVYMGPAMVRFENVTVLAKANVYFDGKVVSHTLLFEAGVKKTIGLIYPGEFHFSTDAAERMDITAGNCRVRIDGSESWNDYGPGTHFNVPPRAGFDIVVASGIAEYVCSFE